MGRRIQGPPPGYVTRGELVERMGVPRQHYYKSGLAGWIEDSIDGWEVGTTVLYRVEDAAPFIRWTRVRRGLIALGVLSSISPLVNRWGMDEMLAGTWDAECPRCGGEAVGHGGRVWCPECDG